MDQASFLCDIPSCGKAAKFFEFKESQKLKYCADHAASQVEKGLQLFSLAGYNFASTPQDAVMFEERRAIVTKGLGNLTILSRKCDLELEAAINALESAKKKIMKSVEDRFEEMKAAVTITCSEAKRLLAELEVEFHNFTALKENHLSPASELVCSELNVVPKFARFGVADVSDLVSAVLSDSWTVANVDIYSKLQCLHTIHRKTAIETALKEAALHAEKGISEALQFADALIGDEESFDEGKHQVVAILLRLEKERVERNWKWLQRSWHWIQQHNVAGEVNIEVGLQVASYLSRQCGMFSEAEQVLRYCFETKPNDLSENSMLISTSMCGIYFESAQYVEAEESGVWILNAFGSASFPAEYYWTTLFYLTYSQRRLSKHRKACDILEYWLKRDLQPESKLAEMMRLLTCGIGAYYDGEREEGKKRISQAKRIGISHFPTSLFTALALFFLAELGDAGEKHHKQAQSIFEISAPMSVHAGNNLSCLGKLYSEMGWVSEALEYYNKAKTLLETLAPKSIDAANNLRNLGNLCFEIEKLNEAYENYQQAQFIYQDSAPVSIESRENLKSMGALYCEMGHKSKAVECYRQVHLIYENTAPRSITAAMVLAILSTLLAQLGELQEAEALATQAQEVFEGTDPKPIEAARNLQNLGLLHSRKGEWESAKECYAKAQSIYEFAVPVSMEAANNLFEFGELLRKVKERSAAEDCYRQAQVIYNNLAPQSVSAASNYYNMGLLLEASRDIEAAIGSFKQAERVYGLLGNDNWKQKAEVKVASLRHQLAR